MTRRLKAIIALLLALTCLFSCISCNKEEEKANDKATDAMTQEGETSDELSIEESIDQILNSAESEEQAPEQQPVDTNPLANVPEGTYTDTDANGKAQRDPNYKTVNYESMRAIWLDQYSMTSFYCIGTRQMGEEKFTKDIDKVCKNIAKEGFNTIIVQLRPNGDSFYPSEYYAPSSYVVGKYGNEFQYDMLKIFIEKAHAYGLSFHAWVNPMRLTQGPNFSVMGEQYPLTQLFKDEAGKAARLSEYKNYYYLIPGVEENKQLVWDGVTEICTNYNVDAVHIDDYFYPTTNSAFDDPHWNLVKDQYSDTGMEAYDRPNYRRQQVNSLVKGMYDAVKAVDPTLWFGISPAGSIGLNYNELYADVNCWCSVDGYCDYIVPQVYWGFEHPVEASKFDVCCQAWQKICTNENVRLIIGIGVYRITDYKTDPEFKEYLEHDDVTKRQLEYIQTMDKNDGFVFYTYNSVFNKSGSTNPKIKKERTNYSPVLLAFGGDDAYAVVGSEDAENEAGAEGSADAPAEVSK